jgi:hypothetical protein
LFVVLDGKYGWKDDRTDGLKNDGTDGGKNDGCADDWTN